ncbi:MAG TPA: hypothetical protein VF079_02420, partial [Sphingomicrobium sp.]
AAANLLAEPLAKGEGVDRLLPKVEKRRLYPTRVAQFVQRMAQDHIFAPVLRPGEPIRDVPLAVRLIDRTPLLQDIPARFVGLGVRRERVRSPAAPPGDRNNNLTASFREKAGQPPSDGARYP